MLDFHRRALELFGQRGLLLDRERGAVVARVTAAAGIALPPAVAEWYYIPEHAPIWKAYSRYDESFLRTLSGKDYPTTFDRAVHDEPRNEWWEVPAVCHDLRGWVTDPVLPLMAECCGGWWWGVVLDGTADPRTVITHDEGETWDFCGASFSTYVYSILFDAVCEGAEGFGRDVWIENYQVSGEQRRQLRKEFRVEPTTRAPGLHPAEFTERFSWEGQRFSFQNLDSPWRSRWRLWATSRAGFEDLVGRLSRMVPALTGLTPEKGPALWIPSESTVTRTETARSGDEDIPF